MTNLETISTDALEAVTGGTGSTTRGHGSGSGSGTGTGGSLGTGSGLDGLLAELTSLQKSLSGLTNNGTNNTMLYLMLGLFMAHRNDVYVYGGGGGWGEPMWGGGWGGGGGCWGGGCCKGW